MDNKTVKNNSIILLEGRKSMNIRINVLFSSCTFDEIIGKVISITTCVKDIQLNDYVFYKPDYNQHCFDLSMNLLNELYVSDDHVFKLVCAESELPMILPIVKYGRSIITNILNGDVSKECCCITRLVHQYFKVLQNHKIDIENVDDSDIVNFSMKHNISCDVQCVYFLNVHMLNNTSQRFFPIVCFNCTIW